MIQHGTNQAGFSIGLVVATILVILVIGGAGFVVLTRAYSPKSASTEMDTTNNISEATDSTTNPAQHYLVIKEWGVQVPLSEDVAGKLTYALGEVTVDPDGNNLQAAKILMNKSALPGNVCVTKNSSIGDVVEIGVQYIRSEQGNRFNAGRYRPTIKENIYTNTQNAYHLNYVMPDCVGNENEPKIQERILALPKLSAVEPR